MVYFVTIIILLWHIMTSWFISWSCAVGDLAGQLDWEHPECHQVRHVESNLKIKGTIIINFRTGIILPWNDILVYGAFHCHNWEHLKKSPILLCLSVAVLSIKFLCTRERRTGPNTRWPASSKVRWTRFVSSTARTGSRRRWRWDREPWLSTSSTSWHWERETRKTRTRRPTLWGAALSGSSISVSDWSKSNYRVYASWKNNYDFEFCAIF